MRNFYKVGIVNGQVGINGTVASFDGNINPALEADFYTYTATATGVVNFAMAAINNSGVDTFLTIYNSPNLNAEIARNDDSNGTLNSFISLNVNANAIYYIRAMAVPKDAPAGAIGVAETR